MTRPIENKQTIRRPQWLPADVWPFDIHAVEFGGHTVAYTDEGEGPTLLLVHDGLWSFVWGQLIERLRADFRVVTLDFPGAGLSPAGSHQPGLERDSRVLEGFVDALGLDHVTVAVHDLGGSVGLGWARRRPEKVNGLVLMNTFSWPPDKLPLRFMLRLVSSRPATAVGVTTNLLPRVGATRGGIGRHLAEPSRRAFKAAYDDKQRRYRFHQLMAQPAKEKEYLERVAAGLDGDLRDLPALTIYGARNDPFGFQERFARHLTDVEAMVVPAGNHFPMADDPGGVAHRIRDWHGRKVARIGARWTQSPV